MDQLANPEIWIALATLTALELVLGVDNIIFISILAAKVPPSQRDKARNLGILMAAVTRLGLLLAIAWIVGLTAPLFSVLGHVFSWRDLILIGGGLFLIAKATHEIHQKIEGAGMPASVASAAAAAGTATFGAVVVQIMMLDIVFSLDSIITAVGMVDQRWVMVTAILVSIVFMLAFARPLGEFVERHPTVKVLALAFLIMIGLVLVADGFGHHVPKGYIYVAMAFSVFVEMINLWMRRRAERHAAAPPVAPRVAIDGARIRRHPPVALAPLRWRGDEEPAPFGSRRNTMNTNDNKKNETSRTQTPGSAQHAGPQPVRSEQGSKQASAPGKPESDTAKREASGSGSDSRSNSMSSTK